MTEQVIELPKQKKKKYELFSFIIIYLRSVHFENRRIKSIKYSSFHHTIIKKLIIL